MNIIRWYLVNAIKEKYEDVAITYGYITKNHRMQHKIEKSHVNDAFAIAKGTSGENNEKEPLKTDGNILIDCDEFTVSIAEYNEILIPNDSVTLIVENKTETKLKFFVHEKTINGVGNTHFMENANVDEVSVESGNKVYFPITIHDSRKENRGTFLKETGITEVGVMGLLIDVYYQKDGERLEDNLLYSQSVFIYPNGYENEKKYEREILPKDVILIDNEYITLIATGYKEYDDTKTSVVEVYLVNKTNNALHFSVGDDKYFRGIGLVDGKSVRVTVMGDFVSYIMPQNSSYFGIRFHSLEESILTADTISFSFKVRDYKGNANGTILVEETVQLYPNEK